MDFGEALYFLKKGNKLAREGWNGKGMYIQMIDDSSLEIEKFLVIRNVKGTLNTWVPSISDLFAEDWEVVV